MCAKIFQKKGSDNMAGHSVRVCINNVEFNIRTDENDEYVKLIVNEINGQIEKIRLENPGLSTAIINSLVMMDLCDRAHKAEKKAQNIEDSK